MNKIPHMYSTKQMEEIENFITEKFGESSMIAHEIESEYVHTDTMIVTAENGGKAFVTFGMGAREMESPFGAKRCELVMFSGENFDIQSDEFHIIATEITRISKFPFREDTWIGMGHTLDTSAKFKETFGYEYFAFKKLPFRTHLSGIDEEIEFLQLIPIYEEEREWCVRNHTIALMDILNERYDGKEAEVDFKREMIIPEEIDEDDVDECNLRAFLDIDIHTYYELCDYIKSSTDRGINLSCEMIDEWIAEHR